MEKFVSFILNNYYDPLTHEEFIDMLDEWLANNEMEAEELGVDTGMMFTDDLINSAGLTEDEYWKLDLVADHAPLACDYMLSYIYYNYLLTYFSQHINNYDPTLSDFRPPDGETI